MKTDGFIQIDPTLCTGCRHCAEICPTQAITGAFRRPQSIAADRCVACGQCVQICSAFDSQFDEAWSGREKRMQQNGISSASMEPCFAAWDRSNLTPIKDALGAQNLRMVVHCDAAALASVSEDFGTPAGTIRTGQLVSALRKLGFHHVYSNSLATGFSILEQARELLGRIKSGTGLPVIDTFCPATVKFIEQFYPDLLPGLSGCRSPRQIAGRLTKSCLAQKFKIKASALYNVSLAPCTAHKMEAERDELQREGQREIDAVLTGREFAQWMKQEKINPADLPDSEFDQELQPIENLRGVSSHAGAMARAVLEAMAAYAGSAQDAVEHRADEGGKPHRFSVRMGREEYVATSITGLQEAASFLEDVRRGKSDLQFVELRACPMGCVNGGGQPKVLLPQDRPLVRAGRAEAMQCKSVLHGAALNEHPALSSFRKEFFHLSSGDSSSQLLQTQYVARALDSISAPRSHPNRP